MAATFLNHDLINDFMNLVSSSFANQIEIAKDTLINFTSAFWKFTHVSISFPQLFYCSWNEAASFPVSLFGLKTSFFLVTL